MVVIKGDNGSLDYSSFGKPAAPHLTLCSTTTTTTTIITNTALTATSCLLLLLFLHHLLLLVSSWLLVVLYLLYLGCAQDSVHTQAGSKLACLQEDKKG